MIERDIIKQRKKEFQIREHITKNLRNVGHSFTKVQRTPLGEKVVIYASRPGLVVGGRGQNIKRLTQTLKTKFGLENPQIEVNEVENINLDASIVAERIASSLERFGLSKFKGIGHREMGEIMNAGALGVEITISGKVPSSRARRWRFYQGYLKKCGETSIEGVKHACKTAQLKSGIVGIQVKIMPPETKLPDKVELIKEEVPEKEPEKEESKETEKKEKPAEKEETSEEKKEENKEVKKEEKTKKKIKKEE